MSCPSCLTALGSSEKINFFRKTWHKTCFRCKTCSLQLTSDNAKMRDDENHTLYCIRHYPDDDTISMCSESSLLISSFDGKQNRLRQQSDGEYPSNWTVDDVSKWLGDLSLQQYSDNFRKNDIDGSILVDEIDGVNDDTIKQLIPSLGTQLKFKKALKSLRSEANTPSRPGSALTAAKQASEEQLKLLQTIQQQSEQISSLISTVNSQAKQIEQFVSKLSTIPRPPPPVDAFNKSSSIVQNQLLDLPSNLPKIALVSSDAPLSAIPAIDSIAPSVLPLPTNTNISSTTPVPTSIDGPQGSSGVSFPAVIHPNIDGIAIKPVIDDIYNFQNYGKYAVTIFDQNSENVLVQTLVNVVPENEICMPKKFVLRDSVNNILVGATVKIKLHDNIVFTGTTDSTGTVNMPTTLQKNCYDVEITASDAQHRPSAFRMIVYENRGSDINTQFICRQLDSDQLEIVLKWGLVPRDLDSHLFVSDGRHIYYESKIDGQISLDCDVTNGNGPETIKIRLEPGLKYLYVVHRYSRDGQLTKSGATVTFNNSAISNTGSPYQIFQIPVVNQPDANFWIVCEIDGTTKNIRLFESVFEIHNNYASDQIGKKYLNK